MNSNFMSPNRDAIAELAKPHKPENVRKLIRDCAPSLTVAQLGVALGDAYQPIPHGKATERLVMAITDGRLFTNDPKVTRRDCLLANVTRSAFAQWLAAYGTSADRQSEAAFWAAQEPGTKAAAVAPVRAATQPPSAPKLAERPARRANLPFPEPLPPLVLWQDGDDHGTTA